MAHHRLARARVLERQQPDEHDADHHAPQTRADSLAGAAERGGARKQQRTRQDDGKEPARHPEVLRHDPDLVEQHAREDRDGDDERGIAPEAAAYHDREADQRRQQPWQREVPIGEDAQRVRIVRRQLAARLAKDECVEGEQPDKAHDERRRPLLDESGQPGASRRQRHGRERDDEGAAEREVLPCREVAEKDDGQVHVRPHRAEQVGTSQRRRDRERRDKRRARPRAPRDRAEPESAGDAGDAQHHVVPQEQQQSEQRAGERREEWIAIDVCPCVREQRREQQRLHHDLGVRIASEPDLDDVEREQPRRRRRGRASHQPRAREIHGQQAQDGPDADRRTRARQAGDPLRDGNRGGKQVRELPDDRTGVRVGDPEPHEPERRVLRAVVRREEQLARGRRHRGDGRVGNDDGAALRDLHALVDVRPRILAADDVFGRGKEPPHAQQDDDRRNQGRPRRSRRRGAQSEAPARRGRRGRRDRGVAHQQPRQAVLPQECQPDHHGHRNREADDDGPEEALLGRQGRPSIPIEPGQPEDRGARQPADDRELDDSAQQVQCGERQNWK